MKGSGRPIAAAIAASIFFLVLYALTDFPLPVSAILAVALYFGVYIILKPNRRIGRRSAEDFSNGEYLLNLLDEGKEQLEALRRLASEVKNPKVQGDVRKLTDTGDKILRWLEIHPESIPKSNRFVNYYLKTAVSLTQKYNEFDATGLETPEITAVHQKTADALSMLDTAFDAQYTKLLGGEVMDVSADISVLEDMIRMDHPDEIGKKE